MSKLNEISVSLETPIIEVMKILDVSDTKTVLVLDKAGQLLGTVTDGDVRRGIIKHFSVTDPVSRIMNPNPITATESRDHKNLQSLMLQKNIYAIPVLDANRKVVELVTLRGTKLNKNRKNTVVIMAGGLGSRLGELTADCPKPMLKVGNKPILQTIIEQLKEYGFNNFHISVNHKAEVIENYFLDGRAFGVKIEYIKENERMGTAGSLSLLPQDSQSGDEPIIVINGDVLTKVNFSELLDNHSKNAYAATMCVRKFDFQVPYGVIQTDGEFLKAIEEKPKQSFFVNAGIYVIKPELLQMIPKATYFDMPSLFNLFIEAKKNLIGVFPIHEYWLDIGLKDEFERAQYEFFKVF